MNYHTALFDLDGTLFDYKKAEARALSGAFEKIFGSTPPEDIISVYHGINTLLWQRYEKGEITNKFLRVERFRQLFSRYEVKGSPEDFSKVYLDLLGKGGYLIEGAAELLQYLKGRVRLAAVTNGITDVQESRLSISGIGRYFEAVAISDTEGVAKPDRKIFEILLGRLGIKDSKGVLMIGDSLSSDIKGGINAGIDTCWFNPEAKEPGEVSPTYTVSSFKEVCSLLTGNQDCGL